METELIANSNEATLGVNSEDYESRVEKEETLTNFPLTNFCWKNI